MRPIHWNSECRSCGLIRGPGFPTQEGPANRYSPCVSAGHLTDELRPVLVEGAIDRTGFRFPAVSEDLDDQRAVVRQDDPSLLNAEKTSFAFGRIEGAGSINRDIGIETTLAVSGS